MKTIIAAGSMLIGVIACVGCAGQAGVDPNAGDSIANVSGKHQQTNPDCTLVVPDDALSAQGLATPYRIRATNKQHGLCHETNADDAAFVQAAVLDPATGNVAVYNPLVITDGTSPAIAPVVPVLPANAVVAIWFGYNGDNLTLAGASSTALANANCVNGLGGDIFGQVAFCNAPAFFSAAQSLRQAGKLNPAVPALGTALDGQACPTVRDFAVVDQDPSDNVTSSYLVTVDGSLAQNTSANVAQLAGAAVLTNGSDNRLVALKVDGVLGCRPYQAPDLADPGKLTTAQPLNELFASVNQKAPIALVPPGDPMTLVGGAPSLDKQNLYRAGVGQPAEASATQAQADELTWCNNLLQIAPARMKLDQKMFSAASSPDAGAATNLFTFMAQRFDFTWGPNGLDCATLTGKPSPMKLTVDANGVCTAASITLP
ncbi:MAG TPA: hypothetical protein VF334_19800 [Polyangia bacterium]